MGCKATTKAGNPCKANPLSNSDFCLAHDEKAREKARFSGRQENAGRKPKPRLIDVLREEVEERMAEITAPFWDGLKSDDIDTRQKSAKELLDRTYGRPTQATEISGPDKGPVEVVDVPESPEWHKAVAAVLKQSGALDADDSDQGE